MSFGPIIYDVHVILKPKKSIHYLHFFIIEYTIIFGYHSFLNRLVFWDSNEVNHFDVPNLIHTSAPCNKPMRWDISIPDYREHPYSGFLYNRCDRD